MHPEILDWGVIHIRSYGLMLAVAFLVGTALSLREARRLGLDEDQLVTVILVVLVASVLGARALYVIEHLEEFRRSWGSVLAVTTLRASRSAVRHARHATRAAKPRRERQPPGGI